MNNTLTALKGVQVGHATLADRLTGCTVVLFDKPYPVAYKSFGGGAGTFNTDLLQNGKFYHHRHGLFISGGSLTGLMCASSIMEGLIEKKIGYHNYEAINPSISGAIVFDLGMRIAQLDPQMGREALDNVSKKPVQNGNVGAGTGTSIGKYWYLEEGKSFPGMKAGVGSARIDLPGGVTITALSVVNALGNVILPDGNILAGNRSDRRGERFTLFEGFNTNVMTPENTTISIVGINVDLKTRERYESIAHMASQGQVRAIRPVQTSVDGDTVFVFSTEEIPVPLNPIGKKLSRKGIWTSLTIDIVGDSAAKAVQESIYNACQEAQTIRFPSAYRGVIPAAQDVK